MNLNRTAVLPLTLVVVTAACGDDPESQSDLEQGSAIAGRWQLPPDIHALRQQQYVGYDDA